MTFQFFAGKDCNSPLILQFFWEVFVLNTEKISIESLLNIENQVQDQIDDIILELIKKRKQNKLTQTSLSRLTGIPQATISRIESFNSIPTLQILIKIANALGLTLILK